MPHLDLSTVLGDVHFHYNIATPTSPCSPNIDPNFPSILFIHGEYLSQEVFQAQFCDPQLRSRFNLIAVDLRGFGGTGGLVPEDHTPAAAANDVYLFWEALGLPPLHIFSISIGFHVAFQLAHDRPHMVLSLTLCSTLSAEEPEEMKMGRTEVLEYWASLDTFEEGSDAQLKREDLIMTVLRGCQHMLYSDYITPLADAITMAGLGHARNNWMGSPDKMRSAFVLCVDWHIKRKPFTKDFVAKIRCPISIVHFEDDIAYPLRHARELVSQLRDTGHTDVALTQVPGPYFGHVISPEFVNPILRDHVLLAGGHETVITASESDENSKPLVTPFDNALALCGYMGDSESLEIEQFP